ncbi:hypothetical protein Tco_1015390 [Tanacetum coccineum]|uniref:Reverse transcriptase domain-containing protein n=1 Tax=Tanacetum coccineum TaxID=301880 RepID=A0ABQ5FKS5_9ASTR
MACPEPITPNEGTSNQNATKSVIEGHASALKELLKDPSNRDLIKPLLLDFDDIQDSSDEEIQDDMKGKAKVGDGDLSKPFKEVLKCPFTRRIVEFSSPGHRMPANVKIYDGCSNRPLTAKQGRGSTNFRGGHRQLGYLQEKFLNRFGMLKACDKDPTEISKIIRKANETLPRFKERWVSESNAIPNVPKLMQISSFMSSHKCPELAKRFSDSIPRTVNGMLKRVDDYLRSEEAFRSTELPRGEFQRRDTPARTPRPICATASSESRIPPAKSSSDLGFIIKHPQEILATEHQLHLPQLAPLVGVPNKENLNRYCDYHNEKGHSMNDCFHLKQQLEIALESSKLNHLVKDVRQRGRGWQQNNGLQKAKVINMVQCHSLDRKRKTTMTDEKWMNVPITFPPVLARDLSEEALMVEAEVEGYLVRRIHINEGASIEILFEHCFNMLHPSIRSRLVEMQTMVSGFSREQVKPLGKIELDVCFGGSGRCQRAIMKFTIIPAPSPYNIILGRSGLKQIRAVSSTIHGMMKFPTPWGVEMLVSQTPTVFECRRDGKKQAVEPLE